jgi:hypothetical protein
VLLNFITEDVMKQLLRICAGLILVLALSLPAFAGEILTPPAGPQESPGFAGDIQNPPLADGPQESPGLTGEIPCPGVTGEMPGAGVAGGIEMPGLSLLAALFSLF